MATGPAIAAIKAGIERAPGVFDHTPPWLTGKLPT